MQFRRLRAAAEGARGDLSRAARAVSNLADFLERNPSAVVFGHQQP